MKPTRNAVLLLVPALVIFTALLLWPLLNIFVESFEQYVPGRVGSQNGPSTLENYRELLAPAYLLYFFDTFRISLVATVVGLLVGYPIAYVVARQRSDRLRKLWIGFLVAMMFLSVLVRVYSLALTFGPIGLLKVFTTVFDLNPSGKELTEILVIAGLLHYLIPISALTLIGTIQNISPKLADAAQSLGASRLSAHLSVTIPLSVRGILSAFLISYTLCISAFVIPMILGKGRILFVSNLIFSRFSEVANYPSGSALAIVMLVISLIIIFGISRVVTARWDRV